MDEARAAEAGEGVGDGNGVPDIAGKFVHGPRPLSVAVEQEGENSCIVAVLVLSDRATPVAQGS